MKKPSWNKRDDRRLKAAEFWRALTPAGLEEYLEGVRLQTFTSLSDVIQCYCGRVARDMGLYFVRFTFTAGSIFATDERHGGQVFYVETPEFLRSFAGKARAGRPSAQHVAPRYSTDELLVALRISLGLPPQRIEIVQKGAA